MVFVFLMMNTYLHNIIWCIFFCACNSPIEHQPQHIPLPKIDPVQQQDPIPLGLQKIVAAYPSQQLSASSNHLIWSDGSTSLYQDTIPQKSFEQLLNQPDLEDQMAMVYTKGKNYKIPSRNQDPGRIRVEDFFLKMYGKNKEAVMQQLVEIDFLGTKLKVTRINGIDKKLTKIAQELALYPELKPYLENVGGSFNWRTIAGTNRLSTHSFGMTIDINIKYSNYWRWAVKDKTENGKRPIIYKNRIPLQIVEIFENNGFIWGGKWYHYDTMHFEYRPELLIDL
ncbi:M15 family metallopeptidase [Aureispira anguillae]|uniref:M15 family metallopeptidase n=1 Tax=Aureispira anguillae TaxID=2864201 RepID=A0A915YCY0_9BACT|nr:M15 family metallopeptidase [Aureispira anguillae]BDS10741.1 M15 family metallopeptidase [Aureispira anguillae]